jgi:hypothetical protein
MFPFGEVPQSSEIYPADELAYPMRLLDDTVTFNVS